MKKFDFYLELRVEDGEVSKKRLVLNLPELKDIEADSEKMARSIAKQRISAWAYYQFKPENVSLMTGKMGGYRFNILPMSQQEIGYLKSGMKEVSIMSFKIGGTVVKKDLRKSYVESFASMYLDEEGFTVGIYRDYLGGEVCFRDGDKFKIFEINFKD